MLASTCSYDPLSTVTAVGFDIALLLVITTPPSDYRGADDRVSPLGPTYHDAAVVVPRHSGQEGLHRMGNLLECGVLNQPNSHLREAFRILAGTPWCWIDHCLRSTHRWLSRHRGQQRCADRYGLQHMHDRRSTHPAWRRPAVKEVGYGGRGRGNG
jgi:hypothetical protein